MAPGKWAALPLVLAVVLTNQVHQLECRTTLRNGDEVFWPTSVPGDNSAPGNTEEFLCCSRSSYNW